jgi:hypothetical protein
MEDENIRLVVEMHAGERWKSSLQVKKHKREFLEEKADEDQSQKNRNV